MASEADVEQERISEIIEFQSAIDDRRVERRRTALGLGALAPLTLMLLAAGFVFGGYMWWFPALWTPLFGFGVLRWVRMVLRDREAAERLQRLGFEA